MIMSELVGVVSDIFGDNYMISDDVLILTKGFIGVPIVIPMSIPIASTKKAFEIYLKFSVEANNAYYKQLIYDECKTGCILDHHCEWLLNAVESSCGLMEAPKKNTPEMFKKLIEYNLIEIDENSSFVAVTKNGSRYLELKKGII